MTNLFNGELPKLLDYLVEKYIKDPMVSVIGVLLTLDEYCEYSGIEDKAEARTELTKDLKQIMMVMLTKEDENDVTIEQIHAIDNCWWEADNTTVRVVFGLGFLGYINRQLAKENKEDE